MEAKKKLRTKKEIERAGLKPPLAILGTAGTLKDAPFEDEITEFWGVSTVKDFPGFKKMDRAFELHPRRWWGRPDVLEGLNGFPGPIYMQDKYEEIPNSVKFPYEELKNKFLPPWMGERLFVTNSITWMILLAIYEGYRDISFYGVHMAHESEYGYQRASCAWALGIIQGMHMNGDEFKLFIPEESELLKAQYEYGFYEPSQQMQFVNKRVQGLTAGVQQVSAEARQLDEQRLKTEGALAEAKIIYDHIAGFN